LGREITAAGKRLGKRLPWQRRGQKDNIKMGLGCSDREDDTWLELTQARFHWRSFVSVALILPAFCQQWFVTTNPKTLQYSFNITQKLIFSGCPAMKNLKFFENAESIWL